MTMTVNEVRSKYLEFFSKRGHKIVNSSSLVPENDPTTLFTGSGMQPMLPYLLGEKHPHGVRVTDSQKCFRLQDIDEIGDNRHLTFFEMLGNWSLGDYFKEEQLNFIFDFLVDEIGLDPNKIYVTCFSGHPKYSIPKDLESAEIWKQIFSKRGIRAKAIDLGTLQEGYEKGMQEGRIFFYGDKNWWSRAGAPEAMPINEPGGPDSEIFYEFDVAHNPKYGKFCHPNCDCGRYLEIGNSVFMEYLKISESEFAPLPQKNVDFGGGLERIALAKSCNNDVFTIDIFTRIIDQVRTLSGGKEYQGVDQLSMRIIADHMRAITFLIGDGVTPSNTDRGYFVRRLLRRSIRHADVVGIPKGRLSELVPVIAEVYRNIYSEIYERKGTIMHAIDLEEEKFRDTLKRGTEIFAKLKGEEISAKQAFDLFSTHGFPIDVIKEMATVRGMKVDEAGFENEFKKHQELSRAGSQKKFKGGLEDDSEMSVKYHTATHLLHEALRRVLGDHVEQRGSNITPERLRFDFSHGAKLTSEEIEKIENMVNEKIHDALPVQKIILNKDEALKTNARHLFSEKYDDLVSVYYIGDNLENAFSKEFCGGPHVQNTETLGKFKILKDEAISQGTRRIKAILE